MGKSDFGLRTLGQVFMPARDLERAVAFYRDTLGMTFLFEVPRMAFFDLDGVRLMLGTPEGADEPPPGSILYYSVDELESAHEALVARDVDFDMGPTLIADMPDHELWMAFFHDSEGNQLALMSEEPKG